MYSCFFTGITDKEEAVHIQNLIRSRPKYCKQCDIVVLRTSGTRKPKAEVPFLTKAEQVTLPKHNFLRHPLCLQNYPSLSKQSVC